MTAPIDRVPFVDLARQFHNLADDLTAIFRRVGESGHYILGPEVEGFEREAATFCGTRHALGVADGTSALVLALRALGVGPGDEVITAPNSFIASAGAIAAVGATPRFVDVREDLNLDPERLEDAVGPRTRAIIPVHLTGRPADMKPIMEVARRRGLAVVEDAAQAIGARYYGRPVGALGDIACFSLHPLKNLGVYGDGGLITTDRTDLDERIRRLRNHGLVNRDDCAEWGLNSRLDALQAAIARYKLARLDDWTKRFRAIAERYRNGLGDVVGTPEEREHEFCVYHNFVVLADRRDELMAYLLARGVETKIHYPVLLHRQPAAGLSCSEGDFPTAERLVKRMVSLPIYPELENCEIDRVIDTIRNFYHA